MKVASDRKEQIAGAFVTIAIAGQLWNDNFTNSCCGASAFTSSGSSTFNFAWYYSS